MREFFGDEYIKRTKNDGDDNGLNITPSQPHHRIPWRCGNIAALPLWKFSGLPDTNRFDRCTVALQVFTESKVGIVLTGGAWVGSDRNEE
jgi:hypothetical protein